MDRLRPITRLGLAVIVAAGLVPLGAGPATAVCGVDPDDPPLTIRQMIRQGTTGDPRYDVLFLGRVREVRDPGERGGDVIARLSVRAHPIGWAPHRSRVRFYRPPPGGGISDNFEFHRGRRYAVVAHRRSDGKFVFDGDCGETRKLTQVGMRKLLRLTRSLGLR
jgi:hypothetical protein